MSISITAVVVTFNRKDLLNRCLSALARQTRRPNRVIVVDNASTDGTNEMLSANGWLNQENFVLVSLPTNLGGAGGFANGLEHAVKGNVDWVWMMDDDAAPHDNALESLINRKLYPRNIYASTAVSGDKLSWPMIPEGRADQCIYSAEHLPEELNVDLVPFIGILVSKKLVHKIGLPDEGFFLVADDVEYSFRARKAGAKIVLVSHSRVDHPASEWYSISLLYRNLDILKLVPWKRYYEVRNRFLLHKHHSHRRLNPQSYIGWFLRLTATLIHEGKRLDQLRAYIGGLIDGVKGRTGKRHQVWGL